MPTHTLPNHLLHHNPAVRRRLSGFNGLVFRLHIHDITLGGRINGQGLFEPSPRPADAELHLPPHALLPLLQGRAPDWQDLAVSGDSELGWNILHTLSGLRYRPQDDIRLLFGESGLNVWNQAARFAPLLRLAAQLLESDQPPHNRRP